MDLNKKLFPFLTRLISARTITLSNGDKLVTEVSEDIPSDMNETVFVAKYNDISYPIRIRSRENGDRMSIQGMNGTKKIKAIFIEAKVPREKEKNGRSFVMQVEYYLVTLVEAICICYLERDSKEG